MLGIFTTSGAISSPLNNFMIEFGSDSI